METIKIELTLDAIQAAVQKHAVDISGSSYNNPIRKAVEDAFAKQSDSIKILVDQIIQSSLSDPKFKEQLGQVVMTKMFESAFKR